MMVKTLIAPIIPLTLALFMCMVLIATKVKLINAYKMYAIEHQILSFIIFKQAASINITEKCKAELT